MFSLKVWHEMLKHLGFSLVRPLLHAMDAESAHHATLKALKLMPAGCAPSSGSLVQRLFGLEFPNPLGLAAGFDKNAEVVDRMLSLGFGFVEAGTLTPRPQAGNPRPRLFRLVEDHGVINRMGFNNEGHEAALARLQHRKGRSGIIGINLGANKDSQDRVGDYVQGLETLGPLASYVTINISSPNTPGLRTMQSADELRPLLQRLNDARTRLPKPVPMLLKVAPDLAEDDIAIIAECCSGGEVDGVILTNTTISRPALKSPHRNEAGGLSGQPLFELSTRQLARFYLLTNGEIPLVGVGGIGSAEQAWRKITAGASLLQIYSALIYQGPALVTAILAGLARKLEARGMDGIASAVGSDAAAIAYQKELGR